MVFVDLTCFLSSILEPYYNHTWAQAEEFAEILQIIVLRIRVVLEKFLENFYLVIGESCAISALAGTSTGGVAAVTVATKIVSWSATRAQRSLRCERHCGDRTRHYATGSWSGIGKVLRSQFRW